VNAWGRHYEEASRRRRGRGLRRHRDEGPPIARPRPETIQLGIVAAVGIMAAIVVALIAR
jgi:hypothetical protein